jgi:hypothetical protein
VSTNEPEASSDASEPRDGDRLYARLLIAREQLERDVDDLAITHQLGKLIRELAKHPRRAGRRVDWTRFRVEAVDDPRTDVLELRAGARVVELDPDPMRTVARALAAAMSRPALAADSEPGPILTLVPATRPSGGELVTLARGFGFDVEVDLEHERGEVWLRHHQAPAFARVDLRLRRVTVTLHEDKRRQTPEVWRITLEDAPRDLVIRALSAAVTGRR